MTNSSLTIITTKIKKENLKRLGKIFPKKKKKKGSVWSCAT